MAMDLGLARLIGFAVALVLSVAYTALFIAAMNTIRRKRVTNNISTVIPAVLILLYLLNTATICLQAADIYLAFFKYRDQYATPQDYFLDYGSRILPARDGLFWVMSFLTDALVCWRVWVIWLKNPWATLLPAVLLICDLTTATIMFVYTIRRMLEDSTRLIAAVDTWWMITLGFCIAVNVVAPGLIIGRLWWIARQVGVLGSRSAKPYKQIASALMESGAIYTFSVVAWLIIFASGSLPALYMSACILPTIVAIVPTLIIFRVKTFGSTDPPAVARPVNPWSNRTDVSGGMDGIGVEISVTHYRSQGGISEVDLAQFGNNGNTTEMVVRKSGGQWSSNGSFDDSSSIGNGMGKSDIGYDLEKDGMGTHEVAFPAPPSGLPPRRSLGAAPGSEV
ncbi:hypothetical protein FRC01_004276 [Tulasnella sp. 417]|nr:hypothetical protein FRC01_004276 [Tulasnella sp. 417]